MGLSFSDRFETDKGKMIFVYDHCILKRTKDKPQKL